MKRSKASLCAPVSVTLLALTLALTLALPNRAAAQEFYLGEILQVGYNFCQRGTIPAEGQLLAINQNSALYSLFGTMYGGDGRTSFGIPDLRGRTPMSAGNGPGLSPRLQGQKAGAETTFLDATHLASHSHAVNANNLDGDKPGPGGKLLAAAPPGGSGSETIYSDQGPTVTMSPDMIANSPGGNDLTINIQDPYLVMRYCVVINGTFPSRN